MALFSRSASNATPLAPERKRLLLSIAAGTVAFVLNLAYVSKGGAEMTVLRVNAYVPAGSRVQDDQLKEVTISGEDLKTMRQIFVSREAKAAFVGLPLAEAAVPGQLLTQRSFRLETQSRLDLREDERAVAFKVRDDSLTLVCFIGPNSLVDLWVRGRSGEPVAVMTGARVLALGDAATAPRDNQCQDARYGNVTIAVPEADVQRIFQLMDTERPEVRLALRGGAAASAAR